MEAEKKDNTRGISIGGLVTGIFGSGLSVINTLTDLANKKGQCNNNCAGQPTIYTLQEKECADNLALTKAMYENRLRDIEELNAFRERDIAEKFGLYQNDNANYNKLVERIAKLEQNEAVMAAVEPYKTKIIFDAIGLEAERRNCADNKIVNYTNGTFQPVYVADITPAATSQVKTTYNPLCGCL